MSSALTPALERFFQALSTDEVFRQTLTAALRQSDDARQVVMEMAAAKGLPLDPQDLKALIAGDDARRPSEVLADDELDAVGGGVLTSAPGHVVGDWLTDLLLGGPRRSQS